MRYGGLCVLFLFFFWSHPCKSEASPWAENEGYGAKTGGKLVFGLKHTLFSWMNPWAEAHDSIYKTPWEGFCAGIGKSVVYTAAGAVQLVTFPIPVDFPNVGLGMHIPANHQGVIVKKQKMAGEQTALAEAVLEAAVELKAPETLEAPAASADQNPTPSSPDQAAVK